MAENDSTRTDQDRSKELLAIIIDKLDTTLGSFTSEFRKFNKIMENNSKSTDDKSKHRRSSFDDLDFDNIKSAGKDLDSTISSLQKRFKDLEAQSKVMSAEWKSSSKGEQVGTRYLQNIQQSRITKEHLSKLEDIKNELVQQQNAIKQSASEGTNVDVLNEAAKIRTEAKEEFATIKKELIAKLRELQESDGDTSTEQQKIFDQLQEAENSLRETLSNLRQTAVDRVLERVQNDFDKRTQTENKDFEQRSQQLKESLDELNRTLEVSDRLVTNAEGISSSLSSASSSYADYLRRNVEQKPYEKMKDMISDAQQYFESALKSLNESIDEISDILERDDLSDEDREYYEKQRKLLNQQSKNIQAEQKYWKDAKPSTILFKDAAQTMKTAGLNIVKNLGSSTIKYLEDRYLNVYKEGFNNVYNSIESTRNSVSARLRLDQGGFSELQAEIQDEIEAQGWEGTVTQSDVNEALVSLSSAGITDTEMLKSLALQQSKMSALGSSFNLNNEETLQRIQEMYRNEIAGGATQDEAMSAITNMMDDLLAYEVNIRETIGDAGLINNQMNQVFNQLSNLGLASGATTDEIEKAVESGMYAANASYYAGLDPTVYTSMLQELMDNSTEQNSIINKILEVGSITGESLTRDELERYIREEPSKIYEIIQQTTNSIIANPNVDEKYLREYLDAFGISMSTVDASKLRKSATATTSITDKEITQAEKDQAKAQNKIALQDATYQSKTLTTQKKAENSMTGIATELEKLYKGNEIFEAGFQAVEGLLGGIKEVASNILSSVWTNNISVMSGSDAGSFLTGGLVGGNTANGAKYATAGKALGTAAGVIGVGATFGKHFMEKEEGEDLQGVVEETMLDSSYWGSFGTALGSAAGGPIAGAIVGALMGGASKIGTKAYDYFIDSTETLQKDVAESLEEFSDTYKEEQERYNQATEQLEKFTQMTENEKKLYMLQKGIINDEQYLNESSESIQDLFKKNVIDTQQNIADEAEQILQKTALLTDEKKLTELKIGKEALESDAHTKQKESEDYTEKVAHDTMMNYLGDTYQDLYNMYDYSNMSEDDLRLALSKKGMSQDQLDSFVLDPVSGKTAQQSMAETLREIVATETLVTSGYTQEQASEVTKTFTTHENLLNNYITQNEEFQDKWKSVVSKHPNQDISTLYFDYVEDTGIHPDIAFGKDGISILVDESGLPYLDKRNGKFRESYTFKTGLTEVPYNEYPALLHEGERVLTAEEAEAYNEMSSYAVSNFADSVNNYGNSSNVFNTTSYGLGNFEDSINGQTESLSAILNQILNAIQSLNISIRTGSSISSAAQSLIKGNTNLTQLNTM